MSVLHELAQRSGLQAALSNRDDVGLRKLLKFISQHITNPRYTSLLVDVSEVILGTVDSTSTSDLTRCLDMYAQIVGLSPAVDELFVILQRKLTAEVHFQKSLFELQASGCALLQSFLTILI